MGERKRQRNYYYYFGRLGRDSAIVEALDR